MRRSQPMQPKPMTYRDRAGWVICEFANGVECVCRKREACCCESVQIAVERVLWIAEAGRTAIANRDGAEQGGGNG